MLTGSIVAIITPMQNDGSIDFASYKKLIQFHLEAGTSGITVLGSTGENATLTFDEKTQLIEKTLEYANGRIPIIAGIGSNATHEAVKLTQWAKSLGVDYGLSVTPYYNRPSQEGMYQHFKAVAESCDLPIILYNVPTRTASNLADDTTLRLAEIPNIIALKDSTGDLQRAAYLKKYVPSNFGLFNGDDGTALAFLMQGGHGVISVTANIAPKAMHNLCKAVQAGNIGEAIEINHALQDLHRDLFMEPSPAPTKWAAKIMGLIKEDYVRLPLMRLTAQSEPNIKKALQAAGINF